MGRFRATLGLMSGAFQQRPFAYLVLDAFGRRSAEQRYSRPQAQLIFYSS